MPGEDEAGWTEWTALPFVREGGAAPGVARRAREIEAMSKRAQEATKPRAAMTPQKTTVPGTPKPAVSGLPRVPGVPGRRAYSTGEGRFVTAVRMQEALGGENPYGYALGNPIRYSDPSGNAPCQTLARDQNNESCRECLDRVRQDATTRWPGGTGFQNAMRHCVGACEAAKQCGKSCSNAIYLHELQSKSFYVGGGDPKADIRNNAIGQYFGTHSGQCQRGCYTAYYQGKLGITLPDGTLLPKGSLDPNLPKAKGHR